MLNGQNNADLLVDARQRNPFDRLLKYVLDPRRVSHKYLLQALLCLFLSGPTFFDNFFNACATDIITRLDISHEQFSLLVSIPSITGILCGAVAGMVSLYGSTLTAVITAVSSYLGAIVIAYGIRTSSFSTMMVGRLIFVLCWNLLGSVQKVIIFRQFTGSALAWIFALKIIAIRLGAVSGLYFAGEIISSVGGSLPDAMFFALSLSGISLLCTIAFGYLYRGSSTARLIRPSMIGRRRDRLQDASSSFSWSISSDAWFCCFVIFFYYGGITPFETFGVDYLVTEFGMPRTEAGQALALIPFFSFFSPLLSPIISSVRRQLVAVIFAQALVSVSIWLDMMDFPYAPHLYLCCIGLGHMVVANAVWLALAGVSPTESQKTNAASISSAIYAVSTCSFNWMTGRIRDMTGDYQTALLMLSGLLFLGAVTAAYLYSWGEWRTSLAHPQSQQALLLYPPDSMAESAVFSSRGIIVEDHFVPPS